MAAPYCVVLVASPDEEVADKLTSLLLQGKLAACVQALPKTRSRYWWEGKIQETEEILLVIKTRASLLPEIIKCVKGNHPYSVPEVVSLPIADGNKDYLSWIGDNTAFSPPREPGRNELPRAPEPGL